MLYETPMDNTIEIQRLLAIPLEDTAQGLCVQGQQHREIKHMGNLFRGNTTGNIIYIGYITAQRQHPGAIVQGQYHRDITPRGNVFTGNTTVKQHIQGVILQEATTPRNKTGLKCQLPAVYGQYHRETAPRGNNTTLWDDVLLKCQVRYQSFTLYSQFVATDMH